MLSFSLAFILSYDPLLQGRGQDGTFWFRSGQERRRCQRKITSGPEILLRQALWDGPWAASLFIGEGLLDLPRLLQPQSVASLGLVVPLPQVSRCLGPRSRLLPGAVHPWAWRAASAAVGGGLSVAALPWGPGPGHELPGHWQATSTLLRLSLPRTVRAFPGRSRERILMDSEISWSFTN